MKDKLLPGAGPKGLRASDPGAIPAAQRDYLRSLIADLPEPGEFLFALPLRVVSALLEAYQSKDGCWRVPAAFARECALLGLCEVGGPYLTAFGLKVRRTLREEQQ